jgi:hypothetical protein
MNDSERQRAERPKIFNDYTDTRMPAGYFLFFPALHAKTSQRISADHQPRVMISAGRSRNGFAVSGRLLDGTLHVDLDDELFFRLSAELAERDLKERAIQFEWELDGEGNLLELFLDGKQLGGDGSEGLKSDVSQLAPGASKARELSGP